MLRPQESATREVKNLDGLWRFALESPDLTEPWKAALPGTVECPVPASYNDIFVPDLRKHVGIVWYQRTVRIPHGWSNERIWLRFDSVTHRGEVWVNESKVAEHSGGYTPFAADITEIVKPGEEIRITVAVDNREYQSWQ